MSASNWSPNYYLISGGCVNVLRLRTRTQRVLCVYLLRIMQPVLFLYEFLSFASFSAIIHVSSIFFQLVKSNKYTWKTDHELTRQLYHILLWPKKEYKYYFHETFYKFYSFFKTTSYKISLTIRYYNLKFWEIL